MWIIPNTRDHPISNPVWLKPGITEKPFAFCIDYGGYPLPVFGLEYEEVIVENGAYALLKNKRFSTWSPDLQDTGFSVLLGPMPFTRVEEVITHICKRPWYLSLKAAGKQLQFFVNDKNQAIELKLKF